LPCDRVGSWAQISEHIEVGQRIEVLELERAVGYLIVNEIYDHQGSNLRVPVRALRHVGSRHLIHCRASMSSMHTAVWTLTQ
jgi:hypothetical protein